MEGIIAKVKEWSKNKQHRRAALIIGGAMLLLVVIACISILMRANIQRKYTRAAEIAQESAYQNMIEMTELFSRVEDPNVDVENRLIPNLQARYTAVSSINDALTEAFGAEYAVLSPEQAAEIETAFDEYASAYREGRATGLAQDDMAECIAVVQTMIDERYKPSEDEIIGPDVVANPK